MIELGTVSIKDKGSMVRARGKILSLARDLLFDSITSIRLATMTSEITRPMLKAGQGSHITVGLARRGEGVMFLALGFISARPVDEVPKGMLERVFDEVEADGPLSIRTFKCLPDPEFEPTEEFIDKERELIGRPTRDELYAQLQEAYDKIRQSSRLIQTEKMVTAGTLVAGVVHEMNNPLMAMLHFAEYCLKHTAGDDRRYPVLNDIVKETNRCIDIVQNLLTFSHMEREGEEGYEEEGLVTVIDRVLRLLIYRIEKEGVSITTQYAEGTPGIWMKPSMLQQVFLNLIGNALDALKDSRKKQVRVEVDRDDEFVRVKIADNGHGIKAEDLNGIFDPFFTTKPVGEGTGLGLAISQSIIDMHGGRIACESRPGVGTTFTVLFAIERKGGRAR